MTQVQLCIIHMVRHSLKYVGWKERKAVAADLRAVYTAPTAEAAEHALDAFERKWSGRFPSIAKSWRTNWVNLIPFFSYPPEIRKVIYTTNAIESMQSSLRITRIVRDFTPRRCRPWFRGRWWRCGWRRDLLRVRAGIRRCRRGP